MPRCARLFLLFFFSLYEKKAGFRHHTTLTLPILTLTLTQKINKQHGLHTIFAATGGLKAALCAAPVPPLRGGSGAVRATRAYAALRAAFPSFLSSPFMKKKPGFATTQP